MNRSPIEWCDFTWNPVVGCNNGCSYCYARRQAKRHTDCPDCVSFAPHLHEERLTQPTPRQRPALIFAGSMCDFWSDGVQYDWRRQVQVAMVNCPQHRFLVLTKRPDRVVGGWFHLPNVWLGVSVTCQADLWRLDVLASWPYTGRKFVSFEPLLGPVDFTHLRQRSMDWAIIGAQTGPRAVVPEYEWARRLGYAKHPIFVKENLSKLFPRFSWPQDVPADLQRIREGMQR